MRIVEFARKTNNSMPKKCVDDSIQLLRQHKVKCKGSKVAVLGLGFRGEVTDSRLSPTYKVVNEFLRQGCKIVVHDPYIKKDDLLPAEVTLTDDLNIAVRNASLIFISADHRMYSKLNQRTFSKAKKPLLIFDGRNVLNKANLKNVSILTIGLR